MDFTFMYNLCKVDENCERGLRHVGPCGLAIRKDSVVLRYIDTESERNQPLVIEDGAPIDSDDLPIPKGWSPKCWERLAPDEKAWNRYLATVKIEED